MVSFTKIHIGRAGIPRPRYVAWIREHLRPFEGTGVYAAQERELLHWDNMGIHQMEAVLDILQENEAWDRRYELHASTKC